MSGRCGLCGRGRPARAWPGSIPILTHGSILPSLKKQSPRQSEGLRSGRSPRPALLLGRLRLCVLPAEAFHAPGRIQQLLLASEERVTGRADLDVDVALMGGPGRKAAAAAAHNADFIVSGMNSCLHGVSKLVREIRFSRMPAGFSNLEG